MEDLNKLIESFKKDLDQSLNTLNSNFGMKETSEDSSSKEIESEGSISGNEEDFVSDSDNASSFDCEDDRDYDGVVFTDTAVLADKYSVPRMMVEEIINEFLNTCAGWDVNLYLLDMGNWRLMNRSWESYHAILNSKLDDLDIDDPDKTLFIIGGDDVIPMPKMLNPLPNIGSEYLDVDMRYCYPQSSLEMDDPRVFIEEYPRINVGRLPLESGEMYSDIFEDLDEYLSKSFIQWTKGGIDVPAAIMTTTESWLPSSREMMRDIPTIPVESDLLTVRSNMLVSPDINLCDSSYRSEFASNAANSGFMIFNLHGSDDYECSSYYGEDKDHYEYPEAFQVDTIPEVCPSIITATACYGARYIGYDREHSMLLSSFAAGTMLFVGSCTTALGRGNGNSATDLLIPAGMSESMLKLYNTYLCLGHPAGRALLDAKMDYYHTCSDIDGENEALATIMMFNLYGNPILYMKSLLDDDFDMKAVQSSALRNHYKLNYNPPVYKSIYNKNLSTTTDVLTAVRSCVDNNLSYIHNTIQENLYKTLGLEKKFLDNITTESVNGMQKGFNYTYKMRKGPFEQVIVAKTDNGGKLIDLITTK